MTSAEEKANAPIDPGQVSALVDRTEDVGRLGTAAELAVAPPVAKRQSALATRSRQDSLVSFVTTEIVSFFDMFGRLGVAMVVVFLLSALWTFMLAFIQVHTNNMANAIMKTSDFDNGHFWALPEPEPELMWMAVVLLVLFGIGYLGLVVYMLFFHRLSASAHALVASEEVEPTGKCKHALWWIKQQFTNPTPLKRHYFNAALDLPKLIFQSTTLITYLRRGFPTSLIYFYSILLLANWLVACYRYQRLHVDPYFVLSRLFYMFDLFFAVFAPLVVLVYFVYNFEFDRATFRVREEVLGKGTFDRVARLFGYPAQISGFCSAFNYLQLSGSASLFYKSALNMLSLYKWARIIHALIHNYHERHQLANQQGSTAKAHPGKNDVICQKIQPKLDTGTKSDATKAPAQVKHHRVVSPTLLVAAVFFCAGLGVFIYSIVAIESTKSLCRSYTRCSIASYRWNVGEQHCSCLMFLDRQEAPSTFEEWSNPVDTTSYLSKLALAGELRIIQIINRALPELPDSVRNCKHLEHIILIYTKTERLPDWINEFSDLQYLHYEGDYTGRPLQALPDGMFDNFPRLTFLQLGVITDVPTIPSLSKLHQLQYLAIAAAYSLTELPSFEGLERLNILTIVDVPHVSILPSFQPLDRIQSISLRYRIPACCNGFLTDECDLTDYSCSAKYGEPAVECTNERISAADNATLVKFGSYCPPNMTVDISKTAPTLYSTDTLCGGVLYKQCTMNGKTGMCFNSRMQVINCVTTPEYQVMRRLEIARGVGPECKPSIEEWLGCSA